MTLYEDLIRGNKSYDRIMKGSKSELTYEKKLPWCLGKQCPRFAAMGGSCPKENCRETIRRENEQLDR